MAGLASGEKFVGNITQSGNIPGDFATYWNQITCENEGKWGSVEADRDVMVWSGIERAYKFAKQHGMPYKQHTFVWGSNDAWGPNDQNPQWMKGLSQNEQREEVKEWIESYCDKFDETDLIDVVNEPVHVKPPWYDAIGGEGDTGYDWVIWAFQTARDACPYSTLILNDYNVLRYETDKFIEVAKILKKEGLLDAVGAQAHGLEDQSFAELKSNFDKVAALGVPIYISEYDINIANDDQQKQVMKQQFTFLYENPQVAGITLWGYLYGQTWRQNTGLIRNGEPRPAMNWLCSYFTGQDCNGNQVSNPTPTPYPGASGDHTIIIRAYGTTGEEIINLNVAGNTLASWQLSTSLRDYTWSTNATGAITVAFINDTGDPDVFIDYIVVDGETRQAEDQSYNTGAWGNDQCGGGSYTEWLHCSGEIGFGDLTGVTPTPEPTNPPTDPTGGCNGGGWNGNGWWNGGCGN